MLRKPWCTAALLGALLAATGACTDGTGPEGPLAQSTFDSGADGWTVVGDVEDLTHNASGGNPGGFVSAQDRELGITWYWKAPAAFVGELPGAYRGTLRFDLRQSPTDRPFEDFDVILSGSGAMLVYDTRNDPGTNWTSYQVPLHERAGWIYPDTGEPPTRSQMRDILANATGLQIRGEFQTGNDVGGLDNVVLER